MTDVTKTIGIELNTTRKPRSASEGRKKATIPFAAHLTASSTSNDGGNKPQKLPRSSKTDAPDGGPEKQSRPIHAHARKSQRSPDELRDDQPESRTIKSGPTERGEKQETESEAISPPSVLNSNAASIRNPVDDEEAEQHDLDESQLFVSFPCTENKHWNAESKQSQKEQPLIASQSTPTGQCDAHETSMGDTDDGIVIAQKALSNIPRQILAGEKSKVLPSSKVDLAVPEHSQGDDETDEQVTSLQANDQAGSSLKDMSFSRMTTSSESNDSRLAKSTFEKLPSDAHATHRALQDMTASVHHLASGTISSELNINKATEKNNLVPYSTLPVEIGLRSLSGQKEISIDLSPKELGHVNITISVDLQAQTQVNFFVDQPQTLAMLKHDAPHIRHALEQAGIQLPETGLSFNLSQDNQSHSGSSGQGRSHAQHSPAAPWSKSFHDDTISAPENKPLFQRVHLKHLDLSV